MSFFPNVLQEKDNYDRYIWCLYSALCQMITVGFGKVNIQTDDEIFLCFYVLISGEDIT